MNSKEVDIIEIHWEGPFSLNEIERMNQPSDYGVYQIYGTHNIFGANSLLYIGKTSQQFFALRFYQHKSWLINETSELSIFLGRMGGIEKPSDVIWTKHIDCAEKLLIYFCSPPYNSQNLNNYGDYKSTIVLNFGKRNRLPAEVSTLYRESDYWAETKAWNIYKESDQQ